MTTTTSTNYAELFLLDMAFTDRVKTTTGIISPDTGKVCSLTPHGASYINRSLFILDRRDVSTRSVAWTPATRPSLVMDATTFPDADNALTAAAVVITNTIFALIDRLVFNYNPHTQMATIETDLNTISGGSNVYVPGSASFSSSVVATSIYNDDETTQQISVPTFAELSVNLIVGLSTQTYKLRIYLSNDTWVADYSQTTVVSVVPPLSYQTLYTAPIATSNANVFSTATVTSNLVYNTAEDPMSKQSLSGIMSFLVQLVDSTGTVYVPFNLLYKGRLPTFAEARVAVRAALLDSGVGDQLGWGARAPNVFITSRFYLFPQWNNVVTLPTKKIFPNLVEISDLSAFVAEANLAVSVPEDITLYQVFTAAYNRMVIISVADPTSVLSDDVTPLKRLLTLFPDYQAISSIDPDFALLSADTQNFIKQLNFGLAQASGVAQTNPYATSTDGNLIYYSLVINETELCLVTPAGYNAIIGVAS